MKHQIESFETSLTQIESFETSLTQIESFETSLIQIEKTLKNATEISKKTQELQIIKRITIQRQFSLCPKRLAFDILTAKESVNKLSYYLL